VVYRAVCLNGTMELSIGLKFSLIQNQKGDWQDGSA
jgi:hypothetical protein